ncbi:hypothetical protein NKR23_g3550 [Pleurostoma richardsiae]|uniref:Nudix hydrolase domain-containing protein n=1 Tax=Pleurostoma richardsiae TaxID=41990 RepID=A0AA38VTS1_9PEZI|nr:hypothetical protein NKR23_g3550 [Pleurostoma richardsiae]
MPEDADPTPRFSFTFDPSLAAFNVPLKTFLSSHEQYDAVATGALLFNADGRLLIIRRASHDSMPDRWEIPGGACDNEDDTILHGLAREVWEESGLVISSIVRCVGPDDGTVFFTRRGLRVCKFTFLATVVEATTVRLDPNEHQSYLWVTEDEFVTRRAFSGGSMVGLTFTTPAQEATISEGFRLHGATAATSG